VALLGLVLAAVGCGEGSASVSGKVTLNGQPLTGGAITFHAAGGRAEGSWIDPEGNYAIARAPVGQVKVTVVATQTREPPKTPRKREVPQHPESQGGGGAPAGKPSAIPPKYKDPEKSPLTYTLSRGSQVINIDLQP
jgi:hypothetical protein